MPHEPSSPVAGRWSRVRRWITPWNVVTALLVVWAVPRLLPHLGAVVGVGSGGNATPSYAVTTLDGRAVTADSLVGDVVLVNFWATWCAPCRVEMPLLQAMHERHRARGFTLLGLSVDRGGDGVVRDFLRARGVSYPVAVVGAEVERAFGGIRGYPTSFLIDRRGTVRHVVIGPLAPATLELAVRRLLEDPQPPRASSLAR